MVFFGVFVGGTNVGAKVSEGVNKAVCVFAMASSIACVDGAQALTKITDNDSKYSFHFLSI